MLSTVLALALFVSCPSPAQDPFRNIPFPDAQVAAQQEKKIVLIDFFTTWCAPCKKLDATTWKDAAVVDWLTKNCVALKLDAEKETALASRFSVGAYPTIVLVKADGTVIDSITGYKDAKTFLSEASAALEGKTALTRAKDKLVGHENDAILRQRVGDELARAGQHEAALAEYLWCFDNGRESPGYGGVRLSFLLSSIVNLGRKHPPAVQALEERRDAAEARLVAGSASFEDAADASALNRTLKSPARTLALYDRLREDGPLPTEVSIAIADDVLELLVQAKRYPDALDLFDDPEGFVKERIEMYAMTQKMRAGLEGESAELEAMMRANVVERSQGIYESMLGTGAKDRAAKVADLLIGFSPSGATYASLIDAAVRAGALDVARSLGERGLAALTGEKDKKAVERAVKRIPVAK